MTETSQFSLRGPGSIMHEYSIAYDIFKTTQQTALDYRARQVKKVCVDIGEMSMVNPEQVQFLFDLLIEEDPVLKGAVLESTVITPETHCTCGYHGDEKFVCPVCGALPELVRGREIVVTHIEIEVDE
jgi:hydrogenase nickel incorporation protein HypA/HybF